jgi:hypothetical protein
MVSASGELHTNFCVRERLVRNADFMGVTGLSRYQLSVSWRLVD